MGTAVFDIRITMHYKCERMLTVFYLN